MVLQSENVLLKQKRDVCRMKNLVIIFETSEENRIICTLTSRLLEVNVERVGLELQSMFSGV